MLRIYIDADVLLAGLLSPSDHGTANVLLQLSEATILDFGIRRMESPGPVGGTGIVIFAHTCAFFLCQRGRQGPFKEES